MGDLNCRIGNMKDYIDNENDHSVIMDLPEPINNILDVDDIKKNNWNVQKDRVSVDSVINDNDKLLINLYNSNGHYIANGRVCKYPECGFTCNTSRGSSMVDYIIVDSTFLVQIDNFHICEQTPISDHSGI